jgi:hypothetical protein
MTGKRDRSTNVPVIWQTGRPLADKRHKDMFKETS